MKKLFAIIMSILMIFCFMPAAALAEEANVCKIGETGYQTLEAALSAAAENAEIELISNVTLNEKLTIDKSITLNIKACTLNSGYTGTNAAITIASGKTVTIKGSGSITGKDGRASSGPTASAYLIEVKSGTTLTLNGVTVKPGATTTGSMTAPATTGVYVSGTLVLNGATVHGGDSSGQGEGGYGVRVCQSSASLTAKDSTIIGGTLESSGQTNRAGGVAVYLQNGRAELTNCKVTGGAANKTANNYRSANGGCAVHIQNSGKVEMTGGALTGGSTTTTPRAGDGGCAVYTPGGSSATLTFSGVTIKGGDSDKGDGGTAISLNGSSDVTIKNDCKIEGGANANGEEDFGGGISFGYSGNGSLSIANSSVDSKVKALAFSNTNLKVTIEGSTISGGADGYSAYLNYVPGSIKAKDSALLGKVYVRENDNKNSFTSDQLSSMNADNDGELVAKVNTDYYFGSSKLTEEIVKNLKRGESIVIYSGDAAMTDVPVGVTVTNSGEGSVSVNGSTLAKDSTYKQVTVTFESSGGTEVENENVETGKAVTKPEDPTKTGYTFAGWYTDAELESPVAWGESGLTIANDTTLYAKWTINKYTVTFESNGGTAVGSRTTNYNTAIEAPENPTKTGYTFAGWYTNEACTEENKYDFETAVTDNVTLYAKWIANTYTISFNANSGEGEMEDQSMTYDTEVALTRNTFKKTGYTFAGWAETKNGNVIYQDAKTVNNLTAENGGSVTLYAVWTPNTYTVEFNPNEGTGSMVGQPMAYDKEASLSKNLFTRIGYTFKEWNTNADGSGTAYKDCAKVKNLTDAADGTVTLYAQWTINEYTVTFNSMSGSAVSPKQADYNTTIEAPKDPTKTGYTFAGWYKDETCTEGNEYNFGTAVPNDITLYAKWTPETYSITYELDEGKNNGDAPTEHTYGAETTLTSPAKTGYTFAGWYTDEKFTGNAITALGAEEYTANITLYAKWTVNKYVVTFNNTGSSVIPAQTVEYNKTITWPNDPTREGYTFKGWFSEKTEWTENMPVNGNTTLTAKWEKNAAGANTSTTIETKTEKDKTTTTTTETVTEGDKTVETKTVSVETVKQVDNGTETTTKETVEVDGQKVKEKTTVVTTTTETTEDGETVETTTTKVTEGNTETEVKNEVTTGSDGKKTEVSTETETVKESDVTTSETAVTTTDADGKATTQIVKSTEDTKNKIATKAEVTTVKKDGGTSVVTAKAKATVTAEANEKLPKTVSIDATKAKKDASEVAAAEVTLPGDSAAKLSKAATEETKTKVEIKTDVATLAIDNTALKTLTAGASDEEDKKFLVLTVEKTSENVEETGNSNTKYELTALLKSSTGKEEPVFGKDTGANNGKITVSVSYEKKNSRSYMTVYYVDEDGGRTEMPTSYSGSILSWTTNHFSEFEVVETVKSSSGGGGSYTPVTPGAGEETKDDAAKTDEEIAAENAAKAAELTSALALKARSAKTAKGSIRVTLTVDEDAIRQIEGLGYTVKYKFYRSTKKASGYAAKYEKTEKTYTNTSGTKGTRYYYKARVMVYDADGALIAKTALSQCKYACRVK